MSSRWLSLVGLVRDLALCFLPVRCSADSVAGCACARGDLWCGGLVFSGLCLRARHCLQCSASSPWPGVGLLLLWFLCFSRVGCGVPRSRLIGIVSPKAVPSWLWHRGESQFSGSVHSRALPSSSCWTVSSFQSLLYILACNFDSHLSTLYMHTRIGNILLCDECELSAFSVSIELLSWAVVAGY